MVYCLLGVSLLMSCLVSEVYGQLSMAEEQEILDVHNFFRSTVNPTATNMEEMVWNTELAMVAQDFANTCTVSSNPGRVSQQSTFASVGENLYLVITNNTNYTAGVQSWNDEGVNYNITTNNCSSSCGRYTQLVWATSNNLGCAINNSCLFGQTALICYYGPGGNVEGQTPYLFGGASCSACPASMPSCALNLCIPDNSSMSTPSPTPSSSSLQSTFSSPVPSSSTEPIIPSSSSSIAQSTSSSPAPVPSSSTEPIIPSSSSSIAQSTSSSPAPSPVPSSSTEPIIPSSSSSIAQSTSSSPAPSPVPSSSTEPIIPSSSSSIAQSISSSPAPSPVPSSSTEPIIPSSSSSSPQSTSSSPAPSPVPSSSTEPIIPSSSSSSPQSTTLSSSTAPILSSSSSQPSTSQESVSPSPTSTSTTTSQPPSTSSQSVTTSLQPSPTPVDMSLGSDPHFSVVLPTGDMLCYSVQGKKDMIFNLITNNKLIMNALFIGDKSREEVTWIGAVGIVIPGEKSQNDSSLMFDGRSKTIHFGDKVNLLAETITSLTVKNGRIRVSNSNNKKSKYPKVHVSLIDIGIKLAIKFTKSHIDLFWHSTEMQPSDDSHGLIGQFFRRGVVIDKVRKILIMPNKEPVPVMRRPVWAFMEREKDDDHLCWTAMNPGYQGKKLIDFSYMDYQVDDVYSGSFMEKLTVLKRSA